MSSSRSLEKAMRERHQLQQQRKVDQANRSIEQILEMLDNLLELGLKRNISSDTIINEIFISPPILAHPGQEPTPPDPNYFEPAIPQESFLERLGVGREKRNREIENRRLEASQQYKNAVEKFDKRMEEYTQKLKQHEASVREKQQKIQTFGSAIKEGQPPIVKQYFKKVLERSDYPSTFPKKGQLSYNPETHELIVEYELPTFAAIMPEIKGFKYIKTRDEIQEIKHNKTDERNLKSLYEGVVSGVALRTIHEIFQSDFQSVISTVVFNGVVNSIDKATGQPIRPCIVSVQTNREEFDSINLAQVDKAACLKHLKAQTSPSSKELVAIKPIVELPKQDSRFVDEIDVLSDLDSRPNLLDMDPFDFEHLIANLFSQIGLETNTTQTSRDGGVDVIAFDDRPILGGKVVIQAKRYRNTVGVESVRALYGVMQDEGATKGIMVCTSSYGTASREFAKGKPIELIDGNGLLYMLKEQGFEAKIEIPAK